MWCYRDTTFKSLREKATTERQCHHCILLVGDKVLSIRAGSAKKHEASCSPFARASSHQEPSLDRPPCIYSMSSLKRVRPGRTVFCLFHKVQDRASEAVDLCKDKYSSSKHVPFQMAPDVGCINWDFSCSPVSGFLQKAGVS